MEASRPHRRRSTTADSAPTTHSLRCAAPCACWWQGRASGQRLAARRCAGMPQGASLHHGGQFITSRALRPDFKRLASQSSHAGGRRPPPPAMEQMSTTPWQLSPVAATVAL